MKKRIATRIIAALLAFAMIMTDLPYNALAADTEVTQPEMTEEEERTDITEDDYVPTDDIYREDVDISKNTESSTTYDVGDNKKTTVFYETPVRFKNENGELVDYDPSLTEIEDKKSETGTSLEGYTYENTEGDKKQYFPETLSEETPILMENDHYSLQMYPVVKQEIEAEAADVTIQDTQTDKIDTQELAEDITAESEEPTEASSATESETPNTEAEEPETELVSLETSDVLVEDREYTNGYEEHSTCFPSDRKSGRQDYRTKVL